MVERISHSKKRWFTNVYTNPLKPFGFGTIPKFKLLRYLRVLTQAFWLGVSSFEPVHVVKYSIITATNKFIMKNDEKNMYARMKNPLPELAL
jgi:hypothetical protein